MVLWNFGGVSTFGQGVDTQTLRNGSSTDPKTPIYSFETGPVRDWLVLGPLSRGKEFSDPLQTLGAPRHGLTVDTSDGASLKWSRASVNTKGAIDFSYENRAGWLRQNPGQTFNGNTNNSVYYAYCKIKGDLGTVRQLLVALDDGGRAWLDGELVIDDVKPGWPNLYEHTITLDFSENTELDLLFEVHNWRGGFLLYCYGGYKLQGRAVYQDGLSPVSDAAVEVSIDGELPKVVPTDATGRFEASAVPFGQSVKLSCLGDSIVYSSHGQAKIPPGGEEDAVTIKVAPPFDFSVDIRRLTVPPGLYEAILETTSGQILLANKSNHTIYTYNGRTFRQHPSEKLREFTTGSVRELAESPNGDLWIATNDDGLFCYTADDRLKHWTASELGQENFALTVLDNGDVLASFRILYRKPDHAVFRFAAGSYRPEKIVLPKCNPIWSIVQHDDPQHGNEIWFVPRLGQIIARSAQNERLITPPVGSQFSSVTATQSDDLWFAGIGLTRFDKEGNWKNFPVADVDLGRNKRNVHIGPGGEVWLVSTEALYCFAGGVMHRIVTPANSSSDLFSCMTENGTLFLAEESGIVHTVNRSRISHYGTRFGIQSGEVTYLSKVDGKIYVAQRSLTALELSRQEFQQFSPDQHDADGNEIKYTSRRISPHGLSNGRILTAPELHAASGKILNTTQSPLYRDSSGNWQAIDRSIWPEAINAYTFVLELRDGRVLLGSRQGIAELQDGKLVDAGLLEGFGDVGMPLRAIEDSAGVVWIATCFGKLLRCNANDKVTFDFPGHTFCSGTVMREYDGYLWIGNSAGLFRKSLSTDEFVEVADPLVDNLSIVGLETGIRPNQLWVISRDGEVFVANEDLRFARLRLQERDEFTIVNGTVTGDDGRLWMATNNGLLAFRSNNSAPLLTIESLDGLSREGANSSTEYSVECDDRWTVALAARDNDRRGVYVRYRINNGQWQYPGGPISKPVDLSFDSKGTYQVQLQAYDGEWNLSNIESLSVRAHLPLWRNPVFRWGLVCLSAGALAMACYFMVQNERSRRSRERLRERLLLEASQARAFAEDTSRERAMLLARVCHDLRNPLSVVGVVRDLLATNEQTGNIPQLTELLDKSASNMKYLTDQLLTYAKSRTEQSRMTLETVDLNRFVDDFAAAAQIRLSETEVQFESSVARDLPAHIVTDREILREILGNIFDNAVRHTKSGVIRLNCTAKSTELLSLEIEDSGEGMKPELVETVFQPFFSGNQAKDNPEGNVGLGMYIVHELSARLGGSVMVESEVGTGTTVRLVLPVNPKADKIAAAELQRGQSTYEEQDDPTESTRAL